jgi:phosphoglycerate dehydrogenase-like enzyme
MTTESTPFRVAVLHDYQRAARRLADWDSLGPDVTVTFFHEDPDDADELIDRLEPFDVVAVRREATRFPRPVLERLPRLRLLLTMGNVNAALDLEAAHDLGITVAGTAGTGTTGVSATIELAWALIFAVARDVPAEHASMRAGGWQVGLGPVLQGKTLGICGLGRFGPLMVPVARALGMRVVAWSLNLTTERAAEVGVERLPREEFFRTADIVTVHIQGSARARGYITRGDLRMMKPTAFFVNTSRGFIVDQDALVDALEEGWIAGAGLDVYDPDPLPADHRLRRAPRAVLTPHIGYVTLDSYGEHFPAVVDAIRAFRRGDAVSGNMVTG